MCHFWSNFEIGRLIVEQHNGIVGCETGRGARTGMPGAGGMPALFGGVLVREVSDERQYVLFNSALLTDRSGQLVGPAPVSARCGRRVTYAGLRGCANG
jgi:hypothetical protein